MVLHFIDQLHLLYCPFFPSLDPQASSATGKKNNFIYFYLNHFIGTHTVAVAKGEESYKALKDGFSPVIKEINEVIEDPKITIEGITYDIKFVLGGDYKV